MRVCQSCKIEKLDTDFHKSTRAKSGLQTYCKQCKRDMDKANPTLRKERADRYRAKKPAEALYRHLAKRAKRNSVPCIDRAGFCDWYYKQELKCEYCGASQDDSRALYNHGLHVDRKIGALGYVDQNMVLACQRCNLVKNGYLSHKQMMEIAGRYFGGPQGNSHDALVGALGGIVNCDWGKLPKEEKIIRWVAAKEALKQAGAE